MTRNLGTCSSEFFFCSLIFCNLRKLCVFSIVSSPPVFPTHQGAQQGNIWRHKQSSSAQMPGLQQEIYLGVNPTDPEATAFYSLMLIEMLELLCGKSPKVNRSRFIGSKRMLD